MQLVSVMVRAPRIFHLFFAGDRICFSKANLQECFMIVDIIKKYERPSRQKVNLSKSEVGFSKGVDIVRRKDITIGVREVGRHEKYLGLLTIIGRS